MKPKNSKSHKNLKSLINFIAEAGLLKRVQRSGWWVVGIDHAESVAAHSFRCAVIGYILAREEKADVEKVLLMTLFNDIHEARIGDFHKMAQRYFDAKAAETKAFYAQARALPPLFNQELVRLRRDYVGQRSRESVIARDADILECLIQAREYCAFGFREAAKFTRQAPRFLKTKTARALWQMARGMAVNEWWQAIGRFER